jgi:preprotein translocase subunit SecF
MKLEVIKQRKRWWTISAIVLLAGIISMILTWSRFGAPIPPSLEFIGGTRLQLTRDCSVASNCDRPIDIAEVRQVLAKQSLAEGSSIQLLGDDGQSLVIRTSNLDVNQREALQSGLESVIGKIDAKLTQNDTVGPAVGKQLLTTGLLSLLVSFAGIAAYLSLRFKFDYAVFAIIALLHDVLITLGLFSLLSWVTGYECDSLFIVALLTIVGFSVNDTVIIYDRIRETIELRPDLSIDEIVNDSVNNTLTRSINTTATVILTLTSIVLFGGGSLKYFALALIMGFVAGAYSSVFIASTLLAWWRNRSNRDGSGGEGFFNDSNDFSDDSTDSQNDKSEPIDSAPAI